MSNLANLPARGLKVQPVVPRGSALEKRYNAWLHAECTCCVTGQPVFQIVHAGDLTDGKGTARKADGVTSLPLIYALHIHEENNRATFWRTVGLPDYKDAAADLFDIFKAGESPEAHLSRMQARVDRNYVAALLGEIDF